MIEHWYVWTSIIACSVAVAATARGYIRNGLTSLRAWMTRPAVSPIKEEMAVLTSMCHDIKHTLESVDFQLHYNGGSTLKDQVRHVANTVDSISVRQTQIISDVDLLKNEYAEHRGFHEGLSA